jgi:hypothetical protein
MRKIYLFGWDTREGNQIFLDYLNYHAAYNHIPSWQIGEYTDKMTPYEKAVFATYFRKKFLGFSIYNVPTELKPGDNLLYYCENYEFAEALYEADNLAESLIKEFKVTGDDARIIRKYAGENYSSEIKDETAAGN